MTTMAQLAVGQTQKETTVNDNFNCVSFAAIFSTRTAGTSGLTWGFFGGYILLDGVLTSIANGSIALSASQTNYVEVNRAGTISTNTTAFSPDKFPLYEIVTNASAITAMNDRRADIVEFVGKAANISVTTADVTPTVAQGIRAETLTFSGALTASRNVIVPTLVRSYRVINNCTGGSAAQWYSLVIKTSGGTGVPIPRGVEVDVFCDGTNVLAVQPGQFVQSLVYAATLGAHNAADGERIHVGTLTGALTIPAPTTPIVGQNLIYNFTQDATGGRVITWNAAFKKAADGAGTANQIAATQFIYNGTNWVQVGGPLAYFT